MRVVSQNGSGLSSHVTTACATRSRITVHMVNVAADDYHADPPPSMARSSLLREPPATERGLRTRAALVAAARKVFERDGYLNARLVDITQAAKCSAGTFYTYFSGKEEVFAAVLEAAQEDMLHPGMPHVAGDDDPAAVIEASNRAYLKAYKRNSKLLGLVGAAGLTRLGRKDDPHRVWALRYTRGPRRHADGDRRGPGADRDPVVGERPS